MDASPARPEKGKPIKYWLDRVGTLPFRVRRLLSRIIRRTPMGAAAAYDLWSLSYDTQDNNPLLFLDKELLDGFLQTVNLQGKIVVDVGCGTGRNWNDLLDSRPKELVGYDVSSGMLDRLREKYPHATAHKLDGYALSKTPDETCDVLISTLTLGYLADLDAAFAEWSRVLRPGGDMIVTDMHPGVGAKAERSFRQGNRTILIRHYVHSLATLRRCAAANRLDVVRVDERLIGDSIKSFYERANSLAVFERMRGTPLMYGAHFRKVAKAT